MKLSKALFPSTRWALVVLLALVFALYLISSTQFHHGPKHHLADAEYVISKFANLIDNLNSSLNQTTKAPNDILNRLPVQIQLNNSETYRLAEEESNLPVAYWERWKMIASSNASTTATSDSNVNFCDNIQVPDPFNVEYNNRYWQQFNSVPPNTSVDSIAMYLYNAYYDRRIWGAPVVKLISVNNQEPLGSKQDWWCLLWFENIKAPVLVKANDYYSLWNGEYEPYLKAGTYHPQLITCPVPKQYVDKVPRAVSLQSQGECNKITPKLSNVLRVIYNKRESQFKKGSIGVCVQAFRFGSYDVSVRLVEWLEMMRLLGADRVYLYVYAANDNMIKVLQHYQLEGLVDWRRMTLPGNQINLPSLYNLLAFKLGPKFWPQELIELNDCLYRNLYRHDYLAVIDIDEVIMPQKVANWHQLIETIEGRLSSRDLKSKSHYSSRHSHVCEVYQESIYKKKPIPDFLYMSRHVKRGKPLPSYQTPKCFVRTDLVTAVHNHFPMRCINTTGYKGCKGLTMDLNDGVLLHYRRNQSNPKLAWRNRDCPIEDKSNWRYFDQMLTSVHKQLEQIFSLIL